MTESFNTEFELQQVSVHAELLLVHLLVIYGERVVLIL